MKYWPTITTTLSILVIVLLPGSSLPNINFFGFDKLVHFSMFLVWAVAVGYNFPLAPKLTILIIGLGFSLFTELLQLVVEDRSFDLFDMAADTVGVLVGIATTSKFVQLLTKILK